MATEKNFVDRFDRIKNQSNRTVGVVAFLGIVKQNGDSAESVLIRFILDPTYIYETENFRYKLHAPHTEA